MESTKRKAEDNEGALVVKKQKTDENAVVAVSNQSGSLISVNIPRTSNLKAPIMLLEGHKGDIYTARFSSSGKNLASGSKDKTICKKVRDNYVLPHLLCF